MLRRSRVHVAYGTSRITRLDHGEAPSPGHHIRQRRARTAPQIIAKGRPATTPVLAFNDIPPIRTRAAKLHQAAPAWDDSVSYAAFDADWLRTIPGHKARIAIGVGRTAARRALSRSTRSS